MTEGVAVYIVFAIPTPRPSQVYLPITSSITFLQIANMIRFLVDSYNKPIPAILEIPSKDHPYDPAHDSVLSRVKYLFSAESVASSRY